MFARESGGVFAESQLMKVFLSKIDKRLIDLALPMIIMDYGVRTTLIERLLPLLSSMIVLCVSTMPLI